MTEGVAHAAVGGTLPAADGLRRVRLGTGFAPDLELLTGAFARRGERARAGSGHPLALSWAAFQAEAEAGVPGILALSPR